MTIQNATIIVNPKTTRGFLALIGTILSEALGKVIGQDNVVSDILKVSLPPDPKMGDLAYGCFQAAQRAHRPPAQVAQELSLAIPKNQLIDKVVVVGPYVNFFLNRKAATGLILSAVREEGIRYGQNSLLSGKTMMVEYLAPNTNKPLHIGHLRNGVIGTTVASLLEACGARVIRANNINDRGIHIVQSMLAYQLWGNNETPESTGEKGDHFVGRYYVRFHQEVARLYKEWLAQQGISLEGKADQEKEKIKAEFQKQCPLIQRSYKMLSLWEAGEESIIALWKQMNDWVYDGFDKTNHRMGFVFEKVYYESNTYKLGREIISEQLERGVGKRMPDGSVAIDLTDVKLGSNPISLIRKDGTSLYITQDVGLAVTRFGEIEDLSSIIYVVAREQEFHFKVLFEILRRYGYPWHSQLYHLSYGMVNLPSGRMKSREGTVVDADELLDELQGLVAKIIRQTSPEASDSDVVRRAEAIALGALKYMLVSVSPPRDIMFDPEKSISFEGNTGPYLQYACVRIAAIGEKAAGISDHNTSLAEVSDEEFSVIKQLGFYPEVVQRAAAGYDPSSLAAGLYEIAKSFSVFYTCCPVVYDNSVNDFRLGICQAASQVLQNGLGLLGMPVPDRM